MEWAPLVRIYESRLWRRSALFARVAGVSFDDEYARILEAARLSGDEALLDLACGSGIYARRFARALPRGLVVGCDLSPAMLAYAAERARAEGLASLALLRGDALRLPFPGEAFDAANCCGALHLFPDESRALAELRRVLRPGGRLTLAVFRAGEGPRAARWVARQRRWLGVAAYTPPGLAGLLEAAGFASPRILHAGLRWLLAVAEKPDGRYAGAPN